MQKRGLLKLASRTMLRNKKGVVEQGMIMWLGYILITAIAVGIIFYGIREKAEGGLMYKSFAARDMAFLLDTLYASPGDSEVVYELKLGEQNFDVLIGRLVDVGVVGEGANYGVLLKEREGFVWYRFQPYGDFEFVRLISPRKILFSKNTGGINVEKIE